jgi:hypothetical protein
MHFLLAIPVIGRRLAAAWAPGAVQEQLALAACSRRPPPPCTALGWSLESEDKPACRGIPQQLIA